MRRLLGMLASQSVAFLALVIALSGGTAYAVGRTVAKNTVVSRSILDGQVKTPDLANGAVTAAKLAPGTLPAAAAPLTQVTQVSQHPWGYGSSTASGTCNPDTTTYVTCQTATISMAQPGQLLLLGTASVHHQTNDSYHARGFCEFNVNGTDQTSTITPVAKDDDDSQSPDTSATAVIGLATVPAGTSTVKLNCNDYYYATYTDVRVTLVALGAPPE